MYVVSEQTLVMTDVYGSVILLQGPLGAAGAEGRQGEKGAKVTVISFFEEFHELSILHHLELKA